MRDLEQRQFVKLFESKHEETIMQGEAMSRLPRRQTLGPLEMDYRHRQKLAESVDCIGHRNVGRCSARCAGLWTTQTTMKSVLPVKIVVTGSRIIE